MQTIDELWEKVADIELVQVRPSEMEAMYKHCFEFVNPTIVEIGSAHGASSTIFAEAARELNGTVYCIDSYPEDYYNQDKFGLYAKNAFEKNVLERYRGNVFFFDMTSDEAISHIKTVQTQF